MANELEEAIFSSIIKRSGGGASKLLAFIRRIRTRQRFHDKIRADNAVKYWALASDQRCPRTKSFTDKYYYRKIGKEKKKKRYASERIERRSNLFFLLCFFFDGWKRLGSKQTRLYRSRFSNFSNFS